MSHSILVYEHGAPEVMRWEEISPQHLGKGCGKCSPCFAKSQNNWIYNFGNLDINKIKHRVI
jgi:hypothetical protein